MKIYSAPELETIEIMTEGAILANSPTGESFNDQEINYEDWI